MKISKSKKHRKHKRLSHDRIYKKLFSYKEVVQSFVENFGHPLLKEADFSTLKRGPASYVTKNFQERHNDMIWTVRIGDNGPMAVLMLEFQSTYDYNMPMRVYVYKGLYWLSLLEAKTIQKDQPLPLVFSFVLYNGSKPWIEADESEQSDVSENANPCGLEQYFPGYYKGIDNAEPGFTTFTLLDIHRISEEKLSRTTGPIAHILNMEKARQTGRFRLAIEKASRELHDPKFSELRKTIRDWAVALLEARMGSGNKLPDYIYNLRVSQK